MEYLYISVSRIQTSVFAERLLQRNMILKKLLFLFESTGPTGLTEVVMGTIETNFFPNVDPMKQIEYLAVSKEAAYHHVNMSCLRKVLKLTKMLRFRWDLSHLLTTKRCRYSVIMWY